MVKQHYRWDFIGLSTDSKPTPEDSEKVTNGSTFYESDTSKLYVFYETQWYEKTAEGGGGTSNFNQLSNRPKYNGTEMTGSTDIPEVKTYTAGSNVSISSGNVISATDTTYSDFTGTDGTAAGASGLVPAPATTDAGKFLKADGTWDTAGGGGGGVTTLTSADYNFPASSPSVIAGWLLPVGQYIIAPNTDFLPDGNSYTYNGDQEIGVLVLTQTPNNNYATYICSVYDGENLYKTQANGTAASGYPHTI